MKWRIRWLNFVYRHWIPLSLLVTLFLGFSIRYLIHLLGYDPEGMSEIAVDLSVGIFALSFPIVLTGVALYPQLKSLMGMLGSAEETGRETITSFIDEELRILSETVRRMRGAGADLDPVEVAKWVRRCFDTARSNQSVYFGTDSNVPSRYKGLYGDYLRSQEGFLKLSKAASARVLILDTATIREDQNDHPGDSEWFFSWHEKQKQDINLKHIDPTKARHLAKDYKLDCTDVGIWKGKFALLFKPKKEKSIINLRMVFAGEPEYDQCTKFFDALYEEADSVTKEIAWFSDALSEHWPEFVVPEQRLEEEGAFLIEKVLAKTDLRFSEIRILDAAMGIGVETVFLLKNGLYVVGNEIEESLRRKAKEYASRKGVMLPDAQLTKANWLSLNKSFGKSSFHVVLVLGNSLSLLANPGEVRKALTNFYEVLVPDGILVVDERNFQYILGAWTSIAEAPWSNFRYSRKVMYCGDAVRAVPTEKTDKRIIFTYAKVSNGQPTGEPYGTLSMYPFKAQELGALLEETGFSEIEVYADLNLSRMTEIDEAGTADFYTYTARKKA